MQGRQAQNLNGFPWRKVPLLHRVSTQDISQQLQSILPLGFDSSKPERPTAVTPRYTQFKCQPHKWKTKPASTPQKHHQ